MSRTEDNNNNNDMTETEPARATPNPSRPATPANQHEDEQAAHGNEETVEVRVPAWMLRFSNLSINMSPHSISVDMGGAPGPPSQIPLTPTRARRNGASDPSGHITSPQPARNEVPIMVQPSTPQRGAAERSPATPFHSPQLSQHRVTATAQAWSPQVSVPAPYISLPRFPQPIHPLQYGEEAPLMRTLERRVGGPHGYYVVFAGIRPGIYHEYWYVIFFSLHRQQLKFGTGTT